MEFVHNTVLLNESVENLIIKDEGIYVDCTLGGGGHSSEIYRKLGSKGILVGIDQDIYAINYSENRLSKINGSGNFKLINDNFKNIKNICKNLDIEKVDGIIADLGVSSFQLDIKDRGFSYQSDALLDMRMDKNSSLTANEIVNSYKEDDLNRIIREFGEERWSSRIASFIVKEREKKSIKTTYDLVEVIKKAIPAKARRDGPHPAKRTFQAIRIEVNNELDILRNVIVDIIELLNKGGRALFITFHSLEDRIVKEEINKLVNPCKCPTDFPVCICGKKSVIKKISRKPIVPSKKELEMNSRSRSAKLRVVEKI